MNQMGPRILLIGGTYCGLRVLEHLIEHGERVVAFVGQEDEGSRDCDAKLLNICERHQIPTRTVHKLGEETVRWLEDRIRPDLALAIGVDMDIPLSIGGNSRLGLIEVSDLFQSDAYPGVVLRQRGRSVATRQLKAPSEDDTAGAAYMGMVDQILELIDERLDALPRDKKEIGARIEFEESIAIPEVDNGKDSAVRLERAAERYLNADRVLAMPSRLEAYSLLIRAFEFEAGAEWILPGVCPQETVDVLRANGARVRYADIAPRELTIEPGAFEGVRSAQTRALVAVHPFGQPAPLAKLYNYANEAKVELIEDADAALGARFFERRLGSQPCTTLFRLPIGEPGPVLLALPGDLANRIESASIRTPLASRSAAAALGLLENWEAHLSRRREIARHISTELCRYDAFQLPTTPEGRLPVHAGYPLGITRHSRTSAEDLQRLLVESGISARALPVAASERELGELPITDRARLETIILPLHAQLQDKQVEHMLDCIFGYAIG